MFHRIRHLICHALFLLLPGAAFGVEPIIIGQAIDLSGPDGTLGRDYVAGIKTYFDMVNAGGGINGRRIEYIVRDDGGQPASSAAAASGLIERERVDYLLGGIGDAVVQAVLDNGSFRRSNHLLFAPLAGSDQSRSQRVLYWRPSYKQEIRHIFSHFQKLGINEVGVVYQDTPANIEAFRSLRTEADAGKIRLPRISRIGSQGEEIALEARRMSEARPGFVLVIADSINTALFLKAYRKYDAQTFVAGTSLTNLATLVELAGRAAVEWTVFSQVVPNPAAGRTPLQIDHLAMMRKYRDESVSALTLEGFAVAATLVKIIQQRGRSGPSAALQDFVARNGSIDIGGLAAAIGDGNRLSGYLDIALLKKGSGLVF